MTNKEAATIVINKMLTGASYEKVVSCLLVTLENNKELNKKKVVNYINSFIKKVRK